MISLEDALRACSEAIKRDDTNALAYSILGHVYLNLNRYEEAIATLEKTIALHPDDGESTLPNLRIE